MERFDAASVPKSEFQQSLLDEQAEMEKLRYPVADAQRHSATHLYGHDAAAGAGAAAAPDEHEGEGAAETAENAALLPDFHLDGNVQYFADYWQVRLWVLCVAVSALDL